MLETQANPEAVNTAMCKLAENLVEYYKELINARDNNPNMLYGGVIDQEQSEVETTKAPSMFQGSPSRKSLIYSFAERNEIFNSLHPTFEISTDILGKQGQVIRNAYTTYIFFNPRDYKGYLFICEPLEGSHETRVFFIPEKQFKEYETNETNKFVDINRTFIAKSGKEFRETRYTKILKHTDIDSFTDRVSYFVTGRKTSRISSALSLFKQFDSQLFGGELVSKSQLRDATVQAKVKRFRH